ncbi:MAG: M48 family metallopeptidase [Isosphaeraceae bacterium]
MPFSVFIALLIAFGMDLPGPAIPGSSVPFRLLEMAGGVLLVGFLSFGLGAWVAARISHFGYASSRLLRRYTQGSRLLTIAGLGIYAWIVHGIGWSRLVLSNWGLRGTVLIDDLAIFAPFVVIQLLIWSGLYYAERALHKIDGYPSLWLSVGLKTRQAIGLVLPVVLIFIVRQDVLFRLLPDWQRNSAAEPLELAALGTLVLILSPAFIRLAWPTRSLPDGPLRRRLENVARRVGFRFNDLLVWDTRHMTVNACVTGVLPWFRYVLLSDALIDSLSPVEVAAVFGHEVGHVAHRHLPFFGFFFLGSLGVLALAARIFSLSKTLIATIPWVPATLLAPARDILEGTATLGSLGFFFFFVFGALSRRFERQADVFGCKVVSCGTVECPPHFDFEEELPEVPSRRDRLSSLCPVGVQIFSQALLTVAIHNGIDVTARSWRHGSIACRLGFLEQLQTDPACEPRFQRGVRSYRWALSAFLLVTFLLAVLTQSWELLN